MELIVNINKKTLLKSTSQFFQIIIKKRFIDHNNTFSRIFYFDFILKLY